MTQGTEVLTHFRNFVFRALFPLCNTIHTVVRDAARQGRLIAGAVDWYPIKLLKGTKADTT